MKIIIIIIFILIIIGNCVCFCHLMANIYVFIMKFNRVKKAKVKKEKLIPYFLNIESLNKTIIELKVIIKINILIFFLQI